MYLLIIILLTLIYPLALVAIGIRKKLPPYHVIGKTLLSMTIFFVLIFAISAITGEPLGESIYKEIEFSVNEIVKTPSLLEALRLSDIETSEAKAVLMNVYTRLINMLPSIVITWGLVLAYLYYLSIAGILKKLDKEVLPMPPFSSFTLPRRAILGSFLIYVLSLIAVKLQIVAEDAMLLNIQSLIEFAFAIQGLAVMVFNITKRKINRFLGGLLCIIVFTSSLGRMLLSFLGFLDLLLGIRQKIENQLKL